MALSSRPRRLPVLVLVLAVICLTAVARASAQGYFGSPRFGKKSNSAAVNPADNPGDNPFSDLGDAGDKGGTEEQGGGEAGADVQGGGEEDAPDVQGAGNEQGDDDAEAPSPEASADDTSAEADPNAEDVPDMTALGAFAPGPAAFEGLPAQLMDPEQTLPGQAFATEGQVVACLLSDYVRVSGPCEGDSRTVTYNKTRDCVDPFGNAGHKEPCDCTPEDYERYYKTETGFLSGSKCYEYYEAKDCKGGTVEPYTLADPLYCSLNGVACSEKHLKTFYSKCQYPKDPTGKDITDGGMSVEVVYYFSRECDPTAKGSIHLPQSSFIPCDTQCGAGSFLHGTKCNLCPAGTFSLGGAEKYDKFYEIDKKIFQTSCRYKVPVDYHNATIFETKPCDGWYAEDLALEVGQFDYVNEWFPDECEADPSRDCHNNLEAVIAMEVDLVRDGYVRFQYSVNSEKFHDGLSFFIDSLKEPMLGIESHQIKPRQVTFMVEQGHHKLYWVYSKDSRFTAGEDIAVIHSIEIDGLALNAFECKKCPAGEFSDPGARECIPCAPFMSAPEEGSAQCLPCPNGQYTWALPRSQCFERPVCDMNKDATAVMGPCLAKTHKRTKFTHWTTPHVCASDTLPPEDPNVDCEPCSPGFYEVPGFNGTLECSVCPQGTARSAEQTECQACAQGTVPVKTWAFSTALKHNASLVSYLEGSRHWGRPGTGTQQPGSNGMFGSSSPSGMFGTGLNGYGLTTSCSGHCGTFGWRIVNGHLDSGAHHGDATQVWLTLNMTLESAGTIWYNYSVDLTAGDKSRGFFFYIDDNIADYVQNSEGGTITPDTVRESSAFTLTAGRHLFAWEWFKVSGEAPANTHDSAIIYDIIIEGSADGAPAGCEMIPQGMQLAKNGSGFEICPPGTWSSGGYETCQQCEENTFSPGGTDRCLPCQEGTTSHPRSGDCFVGIVADPASFCTFFDTINAPDSFENITEPIRYFFYDLTALNRHSRAHPFGPIRAHPGHLGDAAYYINVCNRETRNTTCYDISGKSLQTYACLVQPAEKTLAGHPPAVNLGKFIAIDSLGKVDKKLAQRGFQMSLTGDNCPRTNTPRILNITFICDTKAGYGTPSPWTQGGKRAALDPALGFPDWAKPEGPLLEIEDPDTCFHDMVWYTEFGCPLCSYEEYEEVFVSDCLNNKMYTYRWKHGAACLPSAQAQLPADIPCRPCEDADYVETLSACADAQGRHNKTYSWIPPKLCNHRLETAAKLPPNVYAGPCFQEFLLVPASVLSPKYVFLFALLGVLIVVMLVIWLVTYIKHRRIKHFYQKMVDSEEQATEMGGMNGDGHPHGQEPREDEPLQ